MDKGKFTKFMILDLKRAHIRLKVLEDRGEKISQIT